MYSVLVAVGLVGGPLLGIYGLAHGDAGQLERIWSIMCFALAGAGFVGIFADDGQREPRPGAEAPPHFEHGSPAHAH